MKNTPKVIWRYQPCVNECSTANKCPPFNIFQTSSLSPSISRLTYISTENNIHNLIKYYLTLLLFSLFILSTLIYRFSYFFAALAWFFCHPSWKIIFFSNISLYASLWNIRQKARFPNTAFFFLLLVFITQHNSLPSHCCVWFSFLLYPLRVYNNGRRTKNVHALNPPKKTLWWRWHGEVLIIVVVYIYFDIFLPISQDSTCIIK